MKPQVVLTIPRKASTRTPGIVSRTSESTGTPSITAPSHRKARSARRPGPQLAPGEGRRSLVGGDDVQAGGQAGAHVAVGRLAARGVEHGGLDHHHAALRARLPQRRERLGQKRRAARRRRRPATALGASAAARHAR